MESKITWSSLVLGNLLEIEKECNGRHNAPKLFLINATAFLTGLEYNTESTERTIEWFLNTQDKTYEERLQELTQITAYVSSY